MKHLKKFNEEFNLFGLKFGGKDFKKSPAYAYAKELLDDDVRDKKLYPQYIPDVMKFVEERWDRVIDYYEDDYEGYSKALYSDKRPSGLSEEGEERMITVVRNARKDLESKLSKGKDTGPRILGGF